MIKRVGIFAKRKDPVAKRKAVELAQWLTSKGIDACIDADGSCRTPEGKLRRGSVFSGSELLVVLGGDGTMISAVRGLSGRQAPVLGVNMGGLGFLTEVTLDEMYDAVEQALQGKARIDQRMTLQATHVSAADRKRRTRHVLNDVVINKAAIARMIDLDVSLDEHQVARIKADGLILSTPTGSTAYAMSAGGPIVHSLMQSILMVPICPHTFNLRPVVVSAEARLRVRLREGARDVYVTFDGQEGWRIEPGDDILVRRGRYYVPMVVSPSKTSFEIMRSKLHWGER